MKVEIISRSSTYIQKHINSFLEELKKSDSLVIKMDMASTDNIVTVMITYATKDEIREMKLSTILDNI